MCADGLGVRYNRSPLKLVAWDNVEKISEQYPSFSVTTLCFRLKAYSPWLRQFTDIELRHRLAAGAILHGLFGWLHMSRYLDGNETVAREIAAMPAESLQRKLAVRLFNFRKEQGADIIFPAILCVKADLIRIEASYVVWLNGQSDV
ncbi:hypothetical protein [Asticcacaulis sp. MM231]|uniref:hypothetical protein n=1 Tax=Asticcacaulis sp. MM231 TaxID=3157666 RepID=UPI0032D58F2F